MADCLKVLKLGNIGLNYASVKLQISKRQPLSGVNDGAIL